MNKPVIYPETYQIGENKMKHDMKHKINNHELDDDDMPVGRILNRREFLVMLGGTLTAAACMSGSEPAATVPAPTESAASTIAAPLPTCVAQPEMTEGPYFVDEQLNRFDIRRTNENTLKAGLPMLLTFNISDVTGGNCTALADATVDLWQCDALGIYSDVEDPSFNTIGQNWLRGSRSTNEDGIVQFLTIVPGWYTIRAVHQHIKIRTLETDGNTYEFTTQLFFKLDQLEPIYSTEHYVGNGMPNVLNENDMFYQSLAESDILTLDLQAMNSDELAQLETQWQQEYEAEMGETMRLAFDQAMKASFSIGLDLSDTAVGRSDRQGG